MALNPNMKGTHRLPSEQAGTVVVAGSFQPNGASAIDNTLNRGSKNWSAARTAVGEAEITFDMKYQSLVLCIANYRVAGVSDVQLQTLNYTSPTQTAKGKILVKRLVMSTAAATEWLASDPNSRVEFIAVFKRTKNI